MRALLINAFDKKVEEIDLPAAVDQFNKRIRELLRTDDPRITHSNELLTVIFDENAHWKEDAPGFWSNLMEETPLFGNFICVGRSPFNKEMEDLYEEYTEANFNVRWCSESEAAYYLKEIQDFAKNNRT